MSSAKWTTLVAKIIGISLGCFAGMVPLLFLTPTKKEFNIQDLELFNEIFRPSGVSTEQFSDLMDMGRRCKAGRGQVLVQGGTLQQKTMLLLNGEVAAYPHSEDRWNDPHSSEPVCKYIGRLESTSKKHLDVPSRGSVIGGTLLAGEVTATTPYPRTIIAETPIEWLEWEVTDLQRLMEKEKAIQASFLSIMYGDIMSRLRHDRTSQRYKTYQALVAAVVADFVVEESERKLLRDHKAHLEISDEEHAKILEELGWTVEGFESGSMRRLSTRRAGPASGSDAEQLRQAVDLVEQVVQRMEAA